MARRAIFTCKTADGSEVTLYRDRYDNHILPEHPELARDYDDPPSQIEHALMNPAKVTHGKGRAKIYPRFKTIGTIRALSTRPGLNRRPDRSHNLQCKLL